MLNGPRAALATISWETIGRVGALERWGFWNGCWRQKTQPGRNVFQHRPRQPSIRGRNGPNRITGPAENYGKTSRVRVVGTLHGAWQKRELRADSLVDVRFSFGWTPAKARGAGSPERFDSVAESRMVYYGTVLYSTVGLNDRVSGEKHDNVTFERLGRTPSFLFCGPIYRTALWSSCCRNWNLVDDNVCPGSVVPAGCTVCTGRQ